MNGPKEINIQYYIDEAVKDFSTGGDILMLRRYFYLVERNRSSGHPGTKVPSIYDLVFGLGVSDRPGKETAEEKKLNRLLFQVGYELIHAVCKGYDTYREEVKCLTDDPGRLIYAVADRVAAKENMAVTIIAALCASVLWMMLTIGSEAFCKKYTSK